MKFSEILLEAVDLLSNNPNVIDLRESGYDKTRYEPYTDEHIEILKKYNAPIDSKGQRIGVERTHLVLTTDGRIIVFCYGNRNKMSWKEVIEFCNRWMDKTLQTDIGGIVAFKNAFLIHRSRTMSWTGDKNRYSIDLKDTVRAMFDRGIPASAVIYLGNWAGASQDSLKGIGARNIPERIGTIAQILKKKEIPNKIVLYHGTSTYRLTHIEKEGLVPLPIEDRVWNKGGSVKDRPEHRDDCVYLTASKKQAEYYAKKATNTDRARFSGRKSRNAHSEIYRLQNMLTMAKNANGELRVSAGFTDEKVKDAEERLAKLKKMFGSFYEKFEPAILEITLTKAQYKNLMADDDYLAQHTDASPNDWLQSLSHFGQIAYRGTIPPNEIKVIARGKDAGQISG